MKTVRRSKKRIDCFPRLDDWLGVDVENHVNEGVILVGNDELVKVNEHEILEAVHVSVETVIESCKETFSPNFLLRVHVETPLLHLKDTLLHVVLEEAVDFTAHGVVVQRELAHPQQKIQLDELDKLEALVVVEVEGLHAHSDVAAGGVFQSGFSEVNG